MFNKRVFLDYASTTPVDKKVFNKMKKYFSGSFANSQSIHQEGVNNKKVLNDCRERVSKLIQVKDSEIIFTSGGTDSNNLAIIGFANFIKKEFIKKGIEDKPHIITTNIEHVAVLESLNYLSKNGFDVTYVKVNKDGVVTSDQIIKEMKDSTVLVTVMYANNEIGTVFPLRDISRSILKFKNNNKIDKNNYPYFHSDASQAPNYLDININRIGVDMMSLDGSKIYGPKGVGVLVKKNYLKIDSISYGGEQEFGLKAGTENLPLIVGFAESLEKTISMKDTESERLFKLQKYFINEIKKQLPSVEINGSLEKRLPNNINICIDDINSEFIVIKLDQLGVACAAMTACRNLSDVANSYVVEALDGGCGKSSLRFTMGRDTNKKSIDFVIKKLKEIIE